LLLFLDEVQYDPDWAIVLKTIFDRSSKVFIFATGSAALLMNVNTDVARRAVAEKMLPLSFTEYLTIRLEKPEPLDLSADVRNALFHSADARDAFEGLRQLESRIRGYLLGVGRHESDQYLNHGSLPFMIASGNEAIVYDQISKTLERVVMGDIASTGRLSPDIVSKVSAILYAVADMDAFNFSTIANSFELGRHKVAEIFTLLENTGVLHRVQPVGSHLSQAAATRKPSKFLFSSPAFRAMYYKTIGNTISLPVARGRLLEDLVGMYLYRIFAEKPGQSLTYDSAQGGADFILGFGGRRIVLEVGVGNKGFRQVAATSRKVNADYGLVICEGQLEYSRELGAVKVPLRTFLLS
jgi:predicted AAA+ superfamily ATPase